MKEDAAIMVGVIICALAASWLAGVAVGLFQLGQEITR